MPQAARAPKYAARKPTTPEPQRGPALRVLQGGREISDGGARVRLRNYFHPAYADAVSAARTCYARGIISVAEVTRGQLERIGPQTFEGGHHTVYQHAHFEFEISGVSRQLVWSLLHSHPFYNSEQQSQRYVRMGSPEAHVPPGLQGEARAVYNRAVLQAWRAYEELAAKLKPVAHEQLQQFWRPVRRKKSFAKELQRQAEKRAIESARYVLPIACHTALIHTISGITLHRLQRMAAACDVPREGREVVGKMVAAVKALDPDFFTRIGEAPLAEAELPEQQHAPPGFGSAEYCAAFDAQLQGKSARLTDYGARGPQSVADAVRQVLAQHGLSDEAALALALNPAQNRHRLDLMNVSAHSPIMRALQHAHYAFRKKLSHSADSQDQRHRMVPGSRPLLTRSVPKEVDAVEPRWLAAHPAGHALFRESMEAQWHARAELVRLGAPQEYALYVLPNALAVRFTESGPFIHWLHKWTMRSCLNAQREIYDAAMDEMQQVREVHPQLMRHVGPPCVVRNKLARPRCTEGAHFCGVPVWKHFPQVQRRI